ncbi:hypothetical protein GCM10010430_21980 [Kitasatospora cystarginea]|uniref:Major facilitator superfamily (MFS) profile domain-containing protein n=1 Tax=Kitasatospora cystarginea TaxID=58350 RepID=A0ABN3DS84_9ACTN
MTTPDPYGELAPARRRLITLSLLGCAFLAMLDGTVVGTALPRIVRQIGGGDSWYVWLVTAYLLTSSVGVPIYGRLSDLQGRRRLLLTGLTLFLLGSLACGLSGSMTALIVSRAVQGLGAGALLTLGMALHAGHMPRTVEAVAVGLSGTRPERPTRELRILFLGRPDAARPPIAAQQDINPWAARTAGVLRRPRPRRRVGGHPDRPRLPGLRTPRLPAARRTADRTTTAGRRERGHLRTAPGPRRGAGPARRSVTTGEGRAERAGTEVRVSGP